jgi:hypothetical protein
MKRLCISLLLALGLLMIPAVPAAATDPFRDVCDRPGTSQSEVCRNRGADPITGTNGILTRVVNIIALIAGAAAVIIIIIAGFQFIMAGGDSSKIASARNAIIYAIIGLIVIVLARQIIVFIINNI